MDRMIRNFLKCRYLLLLIAVAVASCSSQEDPMLSTIRSEMVNTLFNYSSYKPIQMQIDTLRSDRYGDTLVFDRVKVIKQLIFQLQQADQQAAADSIASDQQAASELQNQKAQCIDSLKAEVATLNAIVDTLSGNAYGWCVTHSFKCRNKEDQETMATYVFFMSPDGKRIYRYIDDENSSWDDYKALVDELLPPQN